MTRAKRRAGDDNADDSAAEPSLEAMQQERALNFFADTAGHHHHQRKQPGVAGRSLQALLRSPRDAWLFALVVVVAGGVREEIQRAFLLHRFERWLGGGVVGVVITSAAFGAGHLLQGVDAAIATGLLGAFWGATYLRRRSAIASM